MSTDRPHSMTADAWTRISRLPADVRDRVIERSALIYYGGAAASLEEADERALAEEARQPSQRRLGVW